MHKQNAFLNKILSGGWWFGLLPAALLLVGGWLRWQFLRTAQLYPDEFVTLLASQMIAQKGIPQMPSGLFYEHGLLFSYLASLATLFGPARLAARVVSLGFGLLTLALTFWVGRRWFSPAVGLLAAAGLAFAPAAIEWSGRARMYALLQFLVLLAVWLAFKGVTRRRWRWLALLVYLGAVLAHFGAVAVAPPLALAVAVQVARQAPPQQRWRQLLACWPEAVTFGVILLIAFLVKRAGQPKGIAEIEATAAGAVTGVAQVLALYSDWSLNVADGWRAIAPFYVTLPAVAFAPFALVTAALCAGPWLKKSTRFLGDAFSPALFLSLVLGLTTLEMILLVSPDRRDDKYLFMLLPLLFLLGAQGLGWLAQRFWPGRYRLVLILATVVVAAIGWPGARALLANPGDDYDAAFAYVRRHWQPGDTIFTGTPAAAVFYLGRNDFYGVQRRGGYDYRLLTVDGQPVDRWLASPAIRTEAALNQTLAQNRVWLVLERWGLQREYYDLPFQQQLLAQTDLAAEVQGILVLRANANPQPIQPEPQQPAAAVLGNAIRLLGYTAEPAPGTPGRPVRLTLYWAAQSPINHDYTVFVHLRQPAGANVAQADHRPLGSAYPTSLWPVGQTIRETSQLALPPQLPPGEYELWVGMYLLETGERLPVQNDTSGENAVRLGLFKVE